MLEFYRLVEALLGFFLQVAGTNFKLKASIDGASHTVSAFRPLPHTGEPLKINSVVKNE